MGDVIDMGPSRSPLDPPDADPGDDRPAIIAYPGELHETVTAAEDSLVARDDQLYQATGRLVHIVDAPHNSRGGIHRPDGGPIVMAAEPAYVRERMCATARWYRPDRRGKDDMRRIDPPKDIVEAYIARRRYRIRPLHGTVSCPTLRPDGTVAAGSGYDPASGFYLDHDLEVDVEAIEGAAMADAIAAYDTLSECVSTFEFAAPGGESAAVAAIMSATMRRSLPTCPILAISAPEAGSAKTLLVYVVSHIAGGRKPTLIAPGERDEETEKRLVSALLEGDAMILLDNVERPLRGDLLCIASTQPVISLRPLAMSSLTRVRTNTLLVTTGNNLAIRGDLTRRVMLVLLDARVERPEYRRFDRDAVEYVLTRRAELVQAALSITSAYLRAGSPEVDAHPVGSFETWDQWIRRALLWLGIPDPLSATSRVRQEDPDRASMARVYAALADRYPPGRTWYAADAVAAATSDDALRAALDDAISRDISTRSVGYWLRRHTDRICGGLVLRRAGEDRTRTVMWSMEDLRE